MLTKVIVEKCLQEHLQHQYWGHWDFKGQYYDDWLRATTWMAQVHCHAQPCGATRSRGAGTLSVQCTRHANDLLPQQVANAGLPFRPRSLRSLSTVQPPTVGCQTPEGTGETVSDATNRRLVPKLPSVNCQVLSESSGHTTARPRRLSPLPRPTFAWRSAWGEGGGGLGGGGGGGTGATPQLVHDGAGGGLGLVT